MPAASEGDRQSFSSGAGGFLGCKRVKALSASSHQRRDLLSGAEERSVKAGEDRKF